jgi:hypothetical protein
VTSVQKVVNLTSAFTPKKIKTLTVPIIFSLFDAELIG